MKPTLTIGNATVYSGNNLEVLPTLADNSVDSIVCDPPYELGFMGKTWDNSGIAYSVQLWQECLRVLKPGGHLLAFGGTRTWHRLAVAIEDAGFEIRDNIAWLYGSGFPKSHNISKAIDKAANYEGQVIGTETVDIGMQGGSMHAGRETKLAERQIKELSDDAKAWDGWGTALKPAHEPIVVARKPVIGTVAENVLKYGTGAINIDATRIGTTDDLNGGAYAKTSTVRQDGWGMKRAGAGDYEQPQGRWPANIILDEYTAELLDEQSGISKSAINVHTHNSVSEGYGYKTKTVQAYADTGGASRFFYVAKANKRDRNEGLDQLPDHDWRNDGAAIPERENRPFIPSKNHHPTVKPTALMQYLIRLVTPENGVVLDPFAGSGSTGKAAILENKHFIGIELTPEYLPIIEGRLTHAYETMQQRQEEDLFE